MVAVAAVVTVTVIVAAVATAMAAAMAVAAVVAAAEAAAKFIPSSISVLFSFYGFFLCESSGDEIEGRKKLKAE